MINKIVIGWDSREDIAYQVCKASIKNNTMLPLKIVPLKQRILREEGIYKREYKINEHGQKIDKSDGKPFSTEFSFTRFTIPFLSNTGWVLFCDCDMLFRSDISELIEHIDNKYAVMVVKHNHVPTETLKMDGQSQSHYSRKNWSSFVLWNIDHPANSNLTIRDINNKSGSWLHNFSWLDDDEIGELPIEWNWLEGYNDSTIDPKNVHYTRGGPWFEDYQDVAYAEEWIKARDKFLKENPTYEANR